MLNSKVFRAYDIRGVADAEFSDEAVHKLGKAFGSMVLLKGGRSIAVGRDCRMSGARLFEAFAAGAQSSGADVYGLGTVATPLSYFSETHLKADAAVSITGSHNPADWNGFKFSIQKMALFGDDIQQMRERIEHNQFENGQGTLQHVDLIPAYIEHVLGTLRPLERDVRVVCDAGSGMAGPVAPAIYEAMGATVIPLYCEPDGTFPFHHPDPTEEKNLVDLRNTVRDHAADVGLAFDGDADRLGAISGDNRIVWGDQLMLLFAQSILKDHADAHFLAEVKCSDILFSRIRELGGRIEMGKVGHSLIKARMRETGALLAGEMSGHLFFNDRYLGYDDGIYAGARLIELLGRNEVDLTTFLDELPNTVATPEIRIPCSDDTKFAVVEAAKEKLRVDYELVEIDGLRLRTTDGWGLLRASNTQPALVMRVEAKSQESLADVRGIIESVVGELIDG
jgi:phosphomannomutase/phosphoglucomutase